jgi:hypothetical protein
MSFSIFEKSGPNSGQVQIGKNINIVAQFDNSKRLHCLVQTNHGRVLLISYIGYAFKSFIVQATCFETSYFGERICKSKKWPKMLPYFWLLNFQKITSIQKWPPKLKITHSGHPA